MEKLFVYGTLREAKVQQKLYNRIMKLSPDVLHGYKKSQVKINNALYPILIPGEGNIEGFILELSTKEITITDEYETVAYQRKEVVLGSGQKAWVYVKA